MDYIRYLTPSVEPFDPVKLARDTARLVCSYNKRKYTKFYATGVYGGIATAYAVGCCLRCFYCWVDWSRDFPERLGDFYSPEEVLERLRKVAQAYGTKKLRISGSEPTICKGHLIKVLELVEQSEFQLFILETNGILFGVDRDYVEQVSKFKKVHTRVSLKAGTPEGFTQRTGAIPEAFELPFLAIQHLLASRASFHVAAMTDPRIMDATEREKLLERLKEIHPRIVEAIEEEVIDPYDTTLARLRYAGVKLKWTQWTQRK